MIKKNAPGQGRKKGPEICRPNISCLKSDWEQMKMLFPGRVNAMFRGFVKESIKKDK